MLKLLYLIITASTQEYTNKLKGLWEVIPIIENLAVDTDFIPIHIDDTVDSVDSTMDMFIFQSSKNIEWLSDIRGTSVSSKTNTISNSYWSIAKTSYFDEDSYPDLIVCSTDYRTLRLFRNRVRENLEALKKEQLNPEYAENNEKKEDWPRYDLITLEKTSSVIDYLITDLNHDSIPDIIIAVKHKDGTCSIQELIFSSTSSLEYTIQEIWFENSGISELLGVYSIDQNPDSILFLSSTGILSYIINRDPVYLAFSMVKLNNRNKLTSFIATDLNKDEKTDFLIAFDGILLWVDKVGADWVKRIVYKNNILQAQTANVMNENSIDLFLLYNNSISWAMQRICGYTNENSSNKCKLSDPKENYEKFVWDARGDLMTYYEFNIDLESNYQWNKFKLTDLGNNGAIDLLLVSNDQKTIFWARKKPANLKGLGWSPEFWIYIMIYVMLMSLGAGFFHSQFFDKLEEGSEVIKNSSEQSPQFEILPKRNKIKHPRKTTF